MHREESEIDANEDRPEVQLVKRLGIHVVKFEPAKVTNGCLATA